MVCSLVVCAGLAAWQAGRVAWAERWLAAAEGALASAPGEALELSSIDVAAVRARLAQAERFGASGPRLTGLFALCEGFSDLLRGDFRLSEGALERARKALGAHPQVLLLAAGLAQGRGNALRAKRDLDALLSENPTHGLARVLAVDVALDRQRGVEALSHLTRLSEHDPSSAVRVEVLTRKAIALELVGRPLQAKRAWQKAARHPEAVEPWLNLGRLARRSGDDQAALFAFEEAVKRAPTEPEARLGRGLARAKVGDTNGAHTDLLRAAELAPRDAAPRLALGDLFRDRGDHPRAVRHYRMALQQQKHDPAGWVKLGNALYRLARYRKALAAFDQAIALKRDLAAAHNGRGAALLALKEVDPAVEALRRAAQLDPGDPNPRRNLERAEQLSAREFGRRGQSATR